MIIPKPIAIFTHIMGWLLFAFLIVGFTVSGGGHKGFIEVLISPQCLFFLSFYIIVFYLNGYLLFPFLYLRKKPVIYFFIVAVTVGLIFFLKPFDSLLGNSSAGNNLQRREMQRRNMPDNERPHFDRELNNRPPGLGPYGPPQGPPPNGNSRAEGGPIIDIVGIVLFVMTWLFSSAIQILKQWRATEKRALLAETDKANAELSFLRAQINPHFLFNTLNNIYSLVVTKNERGPQAIMKLSQMLRYVTDEATQDYVPLDREVQCISNYIDLQQLRLNKNTTIHFSVTGQATENKIPPLILMTFVENVFKYGISSHEETAVTITIAAAENNIRFCCQNKIFHQSMETERRGIGIDNAKKRLQFLYPGRHTLSIEKQNGSFTVALELKTNANN